MRTTNQVEWNFCGNTDGNSNNSRVIENHKELRPNPFTTYRDPETGRWVVVKSAMV